MEIIDNYTKNPELRVALKDYYEKIPHRYIEHSLRMLNRCADNDIEKISIVRKSLKNNWVGFYKTYE